ncbi:MAG: aldehyde dehydrogenase family protein, partial [Candidatus Marinimicrobia bacterium]|nr:aldehyde dehydrogenase family protein [Candidatus Neomarinimicrobiota bacterium]
MSNLTSINPINNSIVGTYPEHTNEEINKIIYEVNDSFNLWKSLQIEQRCQYFKQLSIALKSRKN